MATETKDLLVVAWCVQRILDLNHVHMSANPGLRAVTLVLFSTSIHCKINIKLSCE